MLATQEQVMGRLSRYACFVAWPLGFVLTTILLVVLCRPLVSWKVVAPDFIQFWTAGELLAAGQSPYDYQAQATTQQRYGWDKEVNGLGRYDFLPYYYPPWLGLACTLLLPLGYPTARVTWYVLDFELAFLSGFLLRHMMTGFPRWATILFVPAFSFTLLAVLMGQVAPLVLFLMAAAWRLLERNHDRAAGWVLAWLTIKPQLTVVVMLGVLVWALRRGRWGVVRGFVAALFVLMLACTCVDPHWLPQMLQAPREVPLVTENSPWMGVTWYSLLKTVHCPSWLAWPAYGLATAAVLFLVLRTALDKQRSLGEVFTLGILAAFFVSPYMRAYDYAILLIPLLLLLAGRLSQIASIVLIAIYLVLPHALLTFLPQESLMRNEIAFFWMPFLLAVMWFPRCWRHRETLAHSSVVTNGPEPRRAVETPAAGASF